MKGESIMKEWNEEFINELIETVDMEEVIGEYVQLRQKGKNLVGFCPFHDERTASFTVTPSKRFYFCFGCGAHGNIITFISKYHNIPYDAAVRYLAGLVGMNPDKTEISPAVAYMKRLKKKRSLLNEKARKHEILDKSILNEFEYGDIPWWRKDGIPQEIMDKYGVGYDRSSRRIVYPVYDTNGDLINIKGRTTIENYKSYDPPIPKYINYEPIGDLDYFQGMNFKKEIIEECGECILFESFKSVMLADSFGYKNSVSVENHSLNRFQLKILLSLKCNVVIAFDSDVPLHEITDLDTVKQLKLFTNVFVVVDRDHLLGESGNKNAPVDKGKDIWETLYNQKIRI